MFIIIPPSPKWAKICPRLPRFIPAATFTIPEKRLEDVRQTAKIASHGSARRLGPSPFGPFAVGLYFCRLPREMRPDTRLPIGRSLANSKLELQGTTMADISRYFIIFIHSPAFSLQKTDFTSLSASSGEAADAFQHLSIGL